MAERYIGLMSGTSMDGVDAGLCEFAEGRFVRVVCIQTLRYEPQLRQTLLRLQREAPALTLAQFASHDNAVAETFAAAATGLLASAGVPASEVRAIGSHGQTVYHDPVQARATLQLGNPSLIAARTGISTVADFRRADIARGGQGAPLVPAFHHAVFASDEPRCVVNLGGIANVTLLPGLDAASVGGFDTGPGNGLMDEWAQQHNGQEFDHNGSLAATGRLDEALLGALLAEPYFARQPPKSSGRGNFNLHWLRQRAPTVDRMDKADVQRTLCELTARTVADAIMEFSPQTRRVLLCGGGVRNHFLVQRLRQLLSPRPVESTAEQGLEPQSVEAAAFAWLAMRMIKGLPGNIPRVTGASAPAILGGLYPA